MTKREHLQKCDFFRQMSSDDLDAISDEIRTTRFAAGEQILKENGTGSSLFIIFDGNATVSKIADLSQGIKSGNLAMLGPGDVIGEVSLIDDLPCSASVEAAGPLVVGILSRDSYQKLESMNPELGIKMLKMITVELVHRLRSLNEHVINQLGWGIDDKPDK